MPAAGHRSLSLFNYFRSLRACAHPARPRAAFVFQPNAFTASSVASRTAEPSSLLFFPHRSATAAMATWSGAGTQEELMHKDECILVDETDAIVGHGSKYDAHRFTAKAPRGRLHRAFSVFLFDSNNRLLLQQRAASKITFPQVWTNTCCSHPLYGYSPTEVDMAADVEAGTVPGAKRAAVRKLLHELGIRPDSVPEEGFSFLTRLRYWAADSSTATAECVWGEHEVDYILFARADVEVDPNPEEVMDTRHVTPAELRAMMDPGSGLLWSPWFRIIAENFLDKWWADLDAVLGEGAHRDTAIHTITPSTE